MRRSTLILALSFCVLVLMTPMLMWLAGRWLSFVDERWMDALGSLSFTVPIGLALAAIVLAIHGVLLHGAGQQALEWFARGGLLPFRPLLSLVR